MYELVLSVFAAQLQTVTHCKLKKGQGGTNPPGSLSRMTRSGLTEIIANSKETMEASSIITSEHECLSNLIEFPSREK